MDLQPSGWFGAYARATLESWAARIDGWRGEGRDVYAYFNNDVGGYAIHNALTLRQLLAV